MVHKDARIEDVKRQILRAFLLGLHRADEHQLHHGSGEFVPFHVLNNSASALAHHIFL